MQESWIAISAARAKAHRLYGVRGWLVMLLWWNTLPMLAILLALVLGSVTSVWRDVSVEAFRALLLLCLPLGLVAVAFLRVRWFPALWFVYCVLQLPAAAYIGAGIRVWMAHAPSQATGGWFLVPLLVLQVVVLLVTMVYIVRSRRVRVTYRHQVRASDPAAVPAAFDRRAMNATTPTDATDYARERAALRRVAQELSSGVLDTPTLTQVMRHHTDVSDSERTAAYVRARMAVLCPPAHVHPPLSRTLACGFGALLVSLAVTALLVVGVVALASSVTNINMDYLGPLVAAGLMLSWLAGLFAGAGCLRRVA